MRAKLDFLLNHLLPRLRPTCTMERCSSLTKPLKQSRHSKCMVFRLSDSSPRSHFMKQHVLPEHQGHAHYVNCKRSYSSLVTPDSEYGGVSQCACLLGATTALTRVLLVFRPTCPQSAHLWWYSCTLALLCYGLHLVCRRSGP